MPTKNELVLRKAKSHVRKLFKKNPDSDRLYHNYAHTLFVVKAAKKIAHHYKLSRAQKHILFLSAWFHDTGYLIDQTEHEKNSVAIALGFLKAEGVKEKIPQGVLNCIMATRLPQKPSTLVEEILCDADMYHLGTKKFSEKNRKLRKEMNRFKEGEKIDKAMWLTSSIEFLSNHHYFTEYALSKLSSHKQKNLNELLAKKTAVLEVQ